jgi:hypothetical protein
MKVRVDSYVFDASAKTVTFSGYVSIDLEAVLFITNTTDNIAIYSFIDPAKGGTAATNVLTLAHDTTAMSDTDKLQIWYDDAAAELAISAAALPLPTGASTSALQSTGNTSLSSINTKLPSNLTVTSTRLLVDGSGVTQPVSGTFWQATQPVSGPLTDAQLRAVAVPVSGTFWQATQPVSLTSTTITGSVAVTGPLTDVQLRATPVPVSLTSTTITGSVTVAQATGTNLHTVIDSGTITTVSTVTALTTLGTITNVVHVDDNGGSLTVDLASTTITGTVAVTKSGTWDITNAGTFVVQENGAALTALQLLDDVVSTLGTTTYTEATTKGNIIGAVRRDADTSAVNTTNEIAPLLVDAQGRLKVADYRPSVLFKGRACTFRTAGRAGTAGQKILSLHNATGSAVTIEITKVFVDLWCTVVKAITVAPPIIRIWKVTVLPTNGTALAKTRIGGTTTSSGSVTVLGDASADGVGSATTLTATLPAGTFLSQEAAPRFITGAGYEMADRLEFFNNESTIELQALEGLVIFLDYTLATQNPTTDMWIAGIEWIER